MAVSSLSLSLASSTLSKRLNLPHLNNQPRPTPFNIITCCRGTDIYNEERRDCKRRPILLGVGALALSLFPASSLLAEGIMVGSSSLFTVPVEPTLCIEVVHPGFIQALALLIVLMPFLYINFYAEVPERYDAFVDKSDGYSYYYPSDWREFDFRGHDSAFKDRYLQLQNVRVSFIPTEKSDVHELGPMEEVVSNLVRHVYATPMQVGNIFDMQERTTDGKNYYTFEYALTSRNFSRAAFATIAVANGRYYTLIVGANERRWRRVRNQMKVVADSFKVLDI